MYGQQAHNTGNNVYTFSAGRKYWQAIHDTGGNDTIVYVGSLASSINLNPGKFSKLSDPITFQRPNGSSVSSRATVTIGPDVLIENARGGSGNDVLSGNDVRNILVGNGGNDTLRGYAGNDHLRGGLGNDSLSGGPDSDSFVFDTRLNTATNRDTVRDFVPGIDQVFLNDAIFSRLTTSGPLADDFFHVGAHAADRNDFIVYHRSAGRLIYDDNGNRPGHEVIVANFVGKPVLSASDFVVI
jgi:serralysin